MYQLISRDRSGNEYDLVGSLTRCIKQAVSLYERMGFTSMILRWDGSNIMAAPRRIRLP